MMEGVLTLLREDIFENFETFLPAEKSAPGETRGNVRATHGILFVEDFDQPAPVLAPPPAEPEIIEPRFCEADIQAAHAAGRELGMVAGRTEHAAVQSELSAAALAAIGDALAATREDAAAVAQHAAEDLAGTMLAVLQAALPAATDAMAGGEVDALLRTLLPALTREPDVQIRVHADLVDTVTASLHTVLPQFGGRLMISGDAALARTDVEVIWQNGEARRDCAALWAELREVLAPYGLPEIDIVLKDAGHGE
jgi:flagellar biosynthesis/type III secretory pathway protein FliH